MSTNPNKPISNKPNTYRRNSKHLVKNIAGAALALMASAGLVKEGSSIFNRGADAVKVISSDAKYGLGNEFNPNPGLSKPPTTEIAQPATNSNGNVKPFTKEQIDQLINLPGERKYTVKPGDSAWEIASNENSETSTNSDAQYAAQMQIEAQIPGGDPSNLQPNQVIYLPAAATNEGVTLHQRSDIPSQKSN